MITSHQRSKPHRCATSSPLQPSVERPDETVSQVRTGSPQRSPRPGTRGRDEWLDVVGDCQSLINTLTAVQDTAIAEAARARASGARTARSARPCTRQVG